jgi:hypothetical protein
MEPEVSLPHSRVSATCRYPKTTRFSPHLTSWRSILTLPTHLRLGLPSGLFPSGFPTKTLYTPLLYPIRITYPAHLILHDFITRKILGEKYRSLSSSLCNLLHSLVTSSLIGPNIHYYHNAGITVFQNVPKSIMCSLFLELELWKFSASIISKFKLRCMTPYDFSDLGKLSRTYSFISYSRTNYVLIKLHKNNSRHSFINSLPSATCFGFVSHLKAEYTAVLWTV